MLNSQKHPRLALAATQALCEGSAFLRNLIIARLIGTEEMGLAIALALGIRIFEMIGEFGLDRLLVQVEEPALPSMRRAVHLLQLVKGGLLAATAVLLAAPVSRALDPGLDPAVFGIAALSLVIRGASNCNYRERQRRGEFVPALVVEGGSNLIAALASAPLAWIMRDYTTLAWVSLIQATLFFTLSHIVASCSYRLGFDRELLIRCFRYGTPIALNGALMFLALQGDRLIVALHFSAAELACFALAAQLTLLPALVGARYVLASELPRFARLAGQRAGFNRHCLALIHRVGAFSVAGAILLGIFGNAIVGLLYGDSYQVAPELFWLLAAGAGIRLVRAVPGTALMAQERTHFLFLSNLPRLLTLLVALWSVTLGGGLAVIVAIGVIGELLSLGVVLFALAGPGVEVPHQNRRRLAEGV